MNFRLRHAQHFIYLYFFAPEVDFYDKNFSNMCVGLYTQPAVPQIITSENLQSEVLLQSVLFGIYRQQ